MRLFKILFILIIIPFLILMIPGTTSIAASSDDFTVENGVLTKYTGLDDNVIIPGNMGITEIGNFAFDSCHDISSISIPDGVTSIGNCAFANLSSLTKITIPQSVIQVGTSAFEGTSIDIPIIVNYGKTLCYVPPKYESYLIPENITIISDTAFQNCRLLHSINIPARVTFIGSGAFDGCSNLKSIEMSKGVTYIGTGAFSGCSSLISVKIPYNTTCIEDFTFEGCISLSSITIPNSIKSIGVEAFSNCRSLKSVSIPNGVVDIGSFAFSECSKLVTVTIPSSVSHIGEGAFSGTSIPKPILLKNGKILCYVPANCRKYTIPDTVNEIKGFAFYGCKYLTSIKIPNRVTTIGRGAFIGIGVKSPIITNYGKKLCFLPNSYTSYKIPDTVTSIDPFAFSGCKSLISITFPKNLKEISELELYDCINLTSVVIPQKVNSINFLFYRIETLTIYGIKGSVAEEYAKNRRIRFCNVGSLVPPLGVKVTGKTDNSVTLSWAPVFDATGYNIYKNGVKVNKQPIKTTIYTISGLLKNKTFNFSVKSVKDKVESTPSTTVNVLVTKSLDFDVKYGTLVQYKGTKSIVEIPDDIGITKIGDNSFMDNEKVTSVVIHEGITYIGDLAFSFGALSSITIPKSVTFINESAFYGCTNLTIKGYKGSYAQKYASDNGFNFVEIK